MDGFRIIEETEQPTTGIRRRVRTGELPAFFDDVFHEVFDALKDAGVEPSGAPFARYRGAVGETVDVEAGFPVAEPVPVSGELVAGALPAARAVEAVHTGPYDTMRTTYEAIEAWLAEQGLTALDDMWEIYESGPESDPDPATWRTRIVWPVTGPQVARTAAAG